MRKTDIEQMQLDEPFHQDTDWQVETESRLELDIPNTHALEHAIHEDLTEHSPYGIGWWLPDRTDLRAIRIFVGDCLAACSGSVSHHLITSRIHWLEFLDSSDQENRVFERTLLRKKPYKNSLDVLASEQPQASADALITSLSSALDCMAGVIVGVAALPIKIKTAGFQNSRSYLRDVNNRRAGDSSADCASVPSLDLGDMINKCGPPGWVEWMLHYRNMLIHRGRRILVNNPSAESVILAPDEIPARWSVNPHLPNHPGLTEVEAFLTANDPSSLLLTERAHVTLKGLSSSTIELVELIASRLLVIWKSRREQPEAMPQPLTRQWNAPTERDWSAFPGYDPGSDPVSPEALTLNPKFGKRLSAAALLDHQRTLWARSEMRCHVPRCPDAESA